MMALAELTKALEELRERSRFRLVVHPDDADAARLEVISAHLVPQVQVMEHKYMRRGTWVLINTAAVVDQLGLDVFAQPA
jgi:hypothetical protein